MTNQRAIILLSQMYIPAFDEEEKEAITKAIEALTDKDKSHKYGICDKCANTYGTLGCCSTVNNEWIYSCEDGMKRYEIQQAYNKGYANGKLAAQEPRVLTLKDLRDIGSVWELNSPPFLWMEINPSYRQTRGFWVAWREIFDMIDGLHPTYDASNYGNIWCCWTLCPTKDQREAIPWE